MSGLRRMAGLSTGNVQIEGREEALTAERIWKKAAVE
jgi:hypothetical protein